MDKESLIEEIEQLHSIIDDKNTTIDSLVLILEGNVNISVVKMLLKQHGLHGILTKYHTES